MRLLIHAGFLILFEVAGVSAAERVAMSRGAGSFVAGAFVLPASISPLAEQGSLEGKTGDAAGERLEFGCEGSSRAEQVIDFSFGESRGIALSFWEISSEETEVSGGAAERLQREIGGLSGVLTIRDLEAGVAGVGRAGQSPPPSSLPAAIAVPIGLVAALGLTLRRNRGLCY